MGLNSKLQSVIQFFCSKMSSTGAYSIDFPIRLSSTPIICD